MKQILNFLVMIVAGFALNQRKFDPTGSGSKGGPKIATYSTSDATATIEGAGYFNALSTVLKTGDAIFVYTSAAGTGDASKIYVVTVSGTTVTLSTSVAFS